MRTISIHTPAKGVTRHLVSPEPVYGISIHTPAKGVTNLLPMQPIPQKNFNPHPREGGDGFVEYLQTLRDISIHTPAKGVTDVFDCLPDFFIFQSTPPRRG